LLFNLNVKSVKQPNVPTNKAILQRATGDTPDDSSPMVPVGDPSGNERLNPGQLSKKE